MQLPRVISFFLAILTFGLIAYAAPTPEDGTTIKKRGNAQIEQVLNTLKSSTDSILPQIDSLTSSGTATSSNLTPLIQQLHSALNTATTSFKSIPAKRSFTEKRQSENDIATLTAGIIRDVSTSLGKTVPFAPKIPGLWGLLGDIDFALNEVLLGLGILLEGVLFLVASLLWDLGFILKDLAFALVLLTLGL